MTGIGAISDASVSFHRTMLEEPTKRAWQAAGGEILSALENLSTSMASDCSREGALSVWALARKVQVANVTTHRAKAQMSRERGRMTMIAI
jgi:hypothetical protein